MYKFNPKDHNYLFSVEEINSREDCRISELEGEEKVLNSKVVEDGFERILNDFKPKHRKVIFSLCSSTRPYIKSLKWKAFHENFGDDADLVICSNGGIIPIEYMCCFPYMEYDAHRNNSSSDNLYKEKMKERLSKFLEKFGDNYDVIIYSFLPNSRNADVIREMNGANGVLLPTYDTYRDCLDNGSPGVNVMRYPQCSHQVLDEMRVHLGIEKPPSPTPVDLF